MQLYQKTKNARYVYCQSGISPPTLQKRVPRYAAAESDGPKSKNTHPYPTLKAKVGNQEESWTLQFRQPRQLWGNPIQNTLKSIHHHFLSLPTIPKILPRNLLDHFLRPWCKKVFHRYNRPTPKYRVQKDTFKIVCGAIRYLSIGACTRYPVLAFFPVALPPIRCTFLIKC